MFEFLMLCLLIGIIWSYLGFKNYKKYMKENVTEEQFKTSPFATLATYMCVIIVCGPLVWIVGTMTLIIAFAAQLDDKTADKDTK